jgi:hypothetical protein
LLVAANEEKRPLEHWIYCNFWLLTHQVFDETIVSKWRTEVLAMENRDISEAMVDFVIEELRYKANIFRLTGAVTVYNGDVVKSDSKVPNSLKEALRTAVRPLEDIREKDVDYHPGSDGKVIDLVHPSLFPLMYDRSRILRDKTIGIEDCFQSMGLGEVLRKDFSLYNHPGGGLPRLARRPYSNDFQWLPCEVDISAPDQPAK